jgi:hypothetical protein
MKTLTDRKLAEEQKITYETQMKAQETRQTLEKETAVAEIQKEIVKADQGVLIAERIADASVKKPRVMLIAYGSRPMLKQTGLNYWLAGKRKEPG